MSLSFLINNVHFALELVGAVSMLMAAWLTLDTYSVRREASTLFRGIGFSLMAAWQVIYATSAGSDTLSFIGFILFLLGLTMVLGSFLKSQKLKAEAIIIVPAFAPFSGYLHIAAAILLFGIAGLSLKHSLAEFNKTWRPLSLGFLMLGIASVLGVFSVANPAGAYAVGQMAAELAGFTLIAAWVWQFLALRIRESLVLIFISASLFLSTVVTLAFSTILISQISSQTEANLRTDTGVLSLAIDGMREQSLAKAELFAQSGELADAISKNDFEALGQLSEEFMQEYNLGFLTVIGSDGSVLARANALSRRGDSLLGERAAEEALVGNSIVTIETSPVEKLSIRAGAPVAQDGKVIGAVIAGYQLDNALVDNIKRVTGLEMLIYEGNTSVAATAFARDGRTRVIGAVAPNAVTSAVLEDGKDVSAQALLFGQPYRATYLPLKNSDEKVIGMISAAKPEQDILDIANSTNRLTLVTVVVIMLVLVYPIYLFTKRLTEE